MTHDIKITINGWGLDTLQQAVDGVYQSCGETVVDVASNGATRREYIHLLDLDRKLRDYSTIFIGETPWGLDQLLDDHVVVFTTEYGRRYTFNLISDYEPKLLLAELKG